MRALSLFSGIGGIDLAAEWAGIETVAFCEYADFPRKVLNKHWPNVPIFKDVKKLDRNLLESEGIDIGTIKLIHGGFPCQPYSQAGKQRGTEDDRDLWPEMFRIIQEIKPDWVVGENVANFANMELDRTISNLESEGYEASTFVLPACGVDAKHQRYRTFIVAHSDGERCIHGQVKEQPTERRKQALSDTSPSSQVLFNSDGERWNEIATKSSFTKDRERERESCTTNCLPARWTAEPELGRVADGISDRLDRIKSLGNAVVPQQIYPIFKAIMEIERVHYPTK